jgi:hypothetical protein
MVSNEYLLKAEIGYFRRSNLTLGDDRIAFFKDKEWTEAFFSQQTTPGNCKRKFII